MRPTRYRIVLRGRLSERFASSFDGMDGLGGQTVVRCAQATSN